MLNSVQVSKFGIFKPKNTDLDLQVWHCNFLRVFSKVNFFIIPNGCYLEGLLSGLIIFKDYISLFTRKKMWKGFYTNVIKQFFFSKLICNFTPGSGSSSWNKCGSGSATLLFCLEIRPKWMRIQLFARGREEGPFPRGSGGETHQEVARGRGQRHRHRTVLQAGNTEE